MNLISKDNNKYFYKLKLKNIQIVVKTLVELIQNNNIELTWCCFNVTSTWFVSLNDVYL